MKMENNYKNEVRNGRAIIKPYYYIRNGVIHNRYTLDDCMELSKKEANELYEAITNDPLRKQEILEQAYKKFLEAGEKEVLDSVLRMNDMQKEFGGDDIYSDKI